MKTILAIISTVTLTLALAIYWQHWEVKKIKRKTNSFCSQALYGSDEMKVIELAKSYNAKDWIRTKPTDERVLIQFIFSGRTPLLGFCSVTFIDNKAVNLEVSYLD